MCTFAGLFSLATADLRKKTKVYYALLRDLPLKAISKRPDEAGSGTAVWDPMRRDFPQDSPCGVWDGRTLDGVVPARPVSPEQADTPVEALSFQDFLLMPASRVEFYVRNDAAPHPEEQHYVLRTKGARDIGNDEWPAIELAEIVLEPNDKTNDISVALNALVVVPASPMMRIQRFVSKLTSMASDTLSPGEEVPPGCVRDLIPTFNEYRRVTFFDEGVTTSGLKTDWSIKTEIIRPTLTGPLQDEKDNHPENAAKTTIGPIPFEEYDLGDGTIDWENKAKPHVCIKIDQASVNGGHKQLWVLRNGTGTLHNFHIHQMKFRLATRKELEGQYNIDLTKSVGSCAPPTLYKCFDDLAMIPGHPVTVPIFWHDTIPVPPGSRVFIVMSYDAEQQIGRFVFHCHILKQRTMDSWLP